jgi:hypothetical protein
MGGSSPGCDSRLRKTLAGLLLLLNGGFNCWVRLGFFRHGVLVFQ